MNHISSSLKAVIVPLLALIAGASAAPAAAAPGDENWPAMRGPLATGVSPSATPPLAWSETKNVKWKVKIPGAGAASPVVWGSRVFVQTAIPTKPAAAPARGGLSLPPPTDPLQFVIQCLDRQTGKLLWQQVATTQAPHEGAHPDGTYASPTSVTDGQHVWAFFGSRGLYCYDMDGKLQWTQDFGRMKTLMAFGEGCSPALYGDTLLVNWDHEGDSFIVALDKKTGETIWKNPREEKTSWATPLLPYASLMRSKSWGPV